MKIKRSAPEGTGLYRRGASKPGEPAPDGELYDAADAHEWQQRNSDLKTSLYV
jgi:hypothetical protein